MTRTIELTDEMLIAIGSAATYLRFQAEALQNWEPGVELQRLANTLEDIQIAAMNCTQKEVSG